MVRSKACRNAAALPALRLAAASDIRSKTSRAGSAARRRPAIRTISNARRVILSPIAGVDADVSFGEVAGPEPRFAFAIAANAEADLALLVVELLFQFLLRERRGQPSLADGHSLHVNIGLG